MTFCCWILSCLVLTSSYSGCLHSLMAIPSKVKPIDTINELAIAQREGKIQVIAVENSVFYIELKVNKSYITKYFLKLYCVNFLINHCKLKTISNKTVVQLSYKSRHLFYVFFYE